MHAAPTRAAAKKRVLVMSHSGNSQALTREIRPRWVVVQQVIRRNQVLRGVAGHQLASDAVYPGILVQANLVRPASPGVPDADDVETRDRLFAAVVVNRAEQAQRAAAAPGLGAELAVELLA